MSYDNAISRAGATALMPEEVSTQLLQNIVTASAAMTLFTRVSMGRKQGRMPVLETLPTAAFRNGETGLIQTTAAQWKNKFLNAEPVDAIVPISRDLSEDLGMDVWASIRPLLENAAARAIDQAVFFGVGKPAIWPDAIVPTCVAKSHVYARGTNAAAAGGLAEDCSQAMAFVEEDGFEVTGIAASSRMKSRLRGARNAQGDKHPEVNESFIYSTAVQYPMRGLWPTGASAAEVIFGDFTQGILGMRQDVEYTILDQAVITDNEGRIVYNLPQQNMVALKMTMRVGFEIANIINYDNQDENTRFPFAVLRSPA